MSDKIAVPSCLNQYRFLVTGGAGFIGSNISEHLLQLGAGKVRVMDNLSTGTRDNMAAFFSNPAFEFVNGDITNLNECLEACSGIDYVIHQAALGSVPRSVIDPLGTNHANVTGFLNVLQASRAKNVKRIVYASSSSVYGDSNALPKTEDSLGSPLSPYAVSKRINELYASVFANTYKIEIVGLRYFNVFGPRQNPEGPYAAVIPLFVNAALNNLRPVIYGDGNQSRDFTYIANVLQANINALFCPKDYCNGLVFNIACGEKTSVNELFRLIKEISQSSVEAEYRTARTGDVRHSQADINKAREILGFSPNVDLYDGLRLTIKWFKNFLGLSAKHFCDEGLF